MKKGLSVVLAVKNEEDNIAACLDSVGEIADEIVVVDDGSRDKTVEIAERYGARCYSFRHKRNFHETKQYALENAKYEWILQLDADERVSRALAGEIRSVVVGGKTSTTTNRLFLKHQKLLEKGSRKMGVRVSSGEIVAYFIPRLNYFLGKPLIHAGVYPDGVIRLVKNGKAYFPAVSVHEQIEVDGGVGWLDNNLEHFESPTLRRYLERMNRYTDLHARELERKKTSRGIGFMVYYSTIKPVVIFGILFIRHKGFLDGMRGFLWSVLSALHYPISYFKYWTGRASK